MLGAFIDDLRSKGLTTMPRSKADELAAGPLSTPARVEAAINRVRDRIDAKRCDSPTGLLIACLGLGSGGRDRAIEIPVVLAVRWDSAEVAFLNTIERTVRVYAALDQARRARQEAQA